jgi:hypothetical protein
MMGRQPGDDDETTSNDRADDEQEDDLVPLGEWLDAIGLGLVSIREYRRAPTLEECEKAMEREREQARARELASLQKTANVVRRIRDKLLREVRELEAAGLATDVDRENLDVAEQALVDTEEAMRVLARPERT